MSEWLRRAFSGGVSLARVNLAGIILMALSAALIAAAGAISGRFSEDKREAVSRRTRISGLILCALGAIISIY